MNHPTSGIPKTPIASPEPAHEAKGIDHLFAQCCLGFAHVMANTAFP